MSDERLRERFTTLRREEAGSGPGFRETLARARSGRAGPRSRRWGGPAVAALAGTALAVLAALVWEVATPRPRLRPASVELGHWALPSDALLQGLPGSDLLRELPSIGAPIDPIRHPSPSHPSGARGPDTTRRLPA